MAKTLDPLKFWEYVYNTFPPSYRQEDIDTNFTLRKYIQAVCTGGFVPCIEELNGLLDLCDSEKVKSKFIPVMFNNLGFEAYMSMPEQFLRKLLPTVVELYKRKGNTDVVEYLASMVSGIKSSVEVSSDIPVSHTLKVLLEMPEDPMALSKLPNGQQLKKVVEKFVPFFLDVVVVAYYSYMESMKLTAYEKFMGDKIVSTILESPKMRILEPKVTDTVNMKTVTENIVASYKSSQTSDGSYTNSIFNLLNEFHLNNIGGYDIIRTSKGESTFVHSL